MDKEEYCQCYCNCSAEEKAKSLVACHAGGVGPCECGDECTCTCDCGDGCRCGDTCKCGSVFSCACGEECNCGSNLVACHTGGDGPCECSPECDCKCDCGCGVNCGDECLECGNVFCCSCGTDCKCGEKENVAPVQGLDGPAYLRKWGEHLDKQSEEAQKREMEIWSEKVAGLSKETEKMSLNNRVERNMTKVQSFFKEENQ